MRQHYEKVIVLCCFLFLFTNIGLPSTSFNVYQPYIIAVDGVGDIGGSVILSVRTLASLIAITFVDRYYHRFDVRRGVFLATLMTAGGFFIYALANNVFVFIIGAWLTGTGYGLGGMVGMTILVNRWFDHDVGGAVGFASVGSGVASMVIPLVAVRIIEGISLHISFLLEGLLALGIGVFIYAFLRNRPSDLGLETKVRATDERAVRENAKEKGAKASTSLPKTQRILLTAALTCVGCLCIGGGTYYSVLLTTQGFDAHFAAATLSVLGAALTVSKFLTGKMFDHFGVLRSSAFAFAVFIAGFAGSCFTPGGSELLALCAGALIGWGAVVGTVGVSVWSIQLADPANRNRSIKNAQVAYSLGGFIINIIPGPLKTLTGTYLTTYAIMLAMCIFAAVVIVGIYRVYHPQR